MADPRSLELQKMLALGLVVALVIGVGANCGSRFFSTAAGDEAEIVTVLKKAERTGLEIELAPRELLVGVKVMYQRLQVSIEGEVAHVRGTLDFTGVFRRDIVVSSLGFEDIRFIKRRGDWEPETSLAPRLVKAIRLLRARDALLNHARLEPTADGGLALVPAQRNREDLNIVRAVTQEADGGAPVAAADVEFMRGYDLKHQPTAWYLRSEREGVAVTEEARQSGSSATGPFDAKVTRTLTMRESAGGDFFLEPVGN